MGERPEALRRPRVRRRTPEGSEEVLLRSWQLANDKEAWEKAMYRAILGGVSLRGVTNLGTFPSKNLLFSKSKSKSGSESIL